MSNFKAELDDREWQKFIGGLIREVKDKPKILKAAYSVFGFRDIIQHFDDEKSPNGNWQKRSDSTNKRYDTIKRTGNAPKGFRPGSFSSTNRLLQLTGLLRKSILAKTIKKKGLDSIQVISDVGYSGQHDEGFGNIPQREFMWLSNDAMEKMSAFIIDTVVKGAG